jgi:hypothetical protein
MAEEIGALYNTKIPGYEEAADIQAALKLYHYGSTTYDESNTDPSQLPNPSLSRHLQDLRDDITDLEDRGIGSEFVAIEPTNVLDGFIWMDANSVVNNFEQMSAASYSNDAPTEGISNGSLWIDKDSENKDLLVYDQELEVWVYASRFTDTSAELDSHEVLNIMGVF